MDIKYLLREHCLFAAAAAAADTTLWEATLVNWQVGESKTCLYLINKLNIITFSLAKRA